MDILLWGKRVIVPLYGKRCDYLIFLRGGLPKGAQMQPNVFLEERGREDSDTEEKAI